MKLITSIALSLSGLLMPIAAQAQSDKPWIKGGAYFPQGMPSISISDVILLKMKDSFYYPSMFVLINDNSLQPEAKGRVFLQYSSRWKVKNEEYKETADYSDGGLHSPLSFVSPVLATPFQGDPSWDGKIARKYRMVGDYSHGFLLNFNLTSTTAKYEPLSGEGLQAVWSWALQNYKEFEPKTFDNNKLPNSLKKPLLIQLACIEKSLQLLTNFSIISFNLKSGNLKMKSKTTNLILDVFINKIRAGENENISVSSKPGLSISDDGECSVIIFGVDEEVDENKNNIGKSISSNGKRENKSDLGLVINPSTVGGKCIYSNTNNLSDEADSYLEALNLSFHGLKILSQAFSEWQTVGIIDGSRKN